MITTKKEYLDLIVKAFKEHIETNTKDFREYCYNNSKCNKHIASFFKEIRDMGLTIGEPYHAHGIGNNNEYRVYLQELVGGDFIVEKNVAKIKVVYGVYGGVSVYVKDYLDDSNLCKLDFAR